MNVMTANQFEMLWNLGYRRLCPIIPPGAPISEKSTLFRRLQKGDDARGKMPGKRWPDGTWSGFDFVSHESTHADLANWNAMGAGVGIKTGSGLVLFDADTINPEWADTIAQQLKLAGLHLPVRIGRAPKVGYLVRTDNDFKYTMFEFGPKRSDGKRDRIEILAEGKQFVASGIHPGTMAPYKWPEGVPMLEDVPFASGAELTAVMDKLRSMMPDSGKLTQEGNGADVEQHGLVGTMATIRQAVAALPNTSNHFPSREAYRDIGYAIKAASGPENEAEALDLFQQWAGQWTDGTNDPEIVEADFRRMKGPFRRGASWLYEQAETHGDFNRASQWFEEHGMQSENLFPEEPKKPVKLFNFTSFADAADTAVIFAARPLIKGLLDQGAMTVLYGESNAGKTFVAMDLAYHIARGDAWSGMRAAKFPVLYVAAEGGLGARKRAVALSMRRGACDGFSFLLHPINLLHPDADLQPLIASIEATGLDYGLIVIDTLSRVMAGGDENGPGDMGAMVRHLDKLRNATKAHIMVVHHSGKDRAKGARGHSLLRAATDTEIEVANREISVTKQRDLDGSFTRGFLLDVVTLGIDEDGDTITSCVVKLVADDEKEIVVPTPRENDVLRALQAVLKASPLPELGATHTEIMAYLSAYGITMNADNVRFYLRSLYDKSITDRIGRGKWRLKAEKKAFSVTDPKRFLELQTEKSGEKSGESVFE